MLLEFLLVMFKRSKRNEALQREPLMHSWIELILANLNFRWDEGESDESSDRRFYEPEVLRKVSRMRHNQPEVRYSEHDNLPIMLKALLLYLQSPHRRGRTLRLARCFVPSKLGALGRHLSAAGGGATRDRNRTLSIWCLSAFLRHDVALQWVNEYFFEKVFTEKLTLLHAESHQKEKFTKEIPFINY